MTAEVNDAAFGIASLATIGAGLGSVFYISTLKGPVEGINVPYSNYTNTYGSTPIDNPYSRTPATFLADQSTVIPKSGVNVAGVLDPMAQRSRPFLGTGSSIATALIGIGLIYIIAKKM